MKSVTENSELTVLDLSAYVGLFAVFLATANICLGLLIAVRYSPSRLWPHRRINIFAFHNWIAYFLLVSVLAHPAILLFSTNIHWRLLDMALPIWSPVQPLENTIGAVSLYLIVVVLLTSYFRLRLGRRRWKLFHYVTYLASACLFFHSILTDPTLKGHPIDLLDGEKVFVESCLFVVLLTTVWAWHCRLRKNREERELRIGRYRALETVNVSE